MVTARPGEQVEKEVGPVFDHRDSGTPEHRWVSALRDAAPPALEVSGFRELVVLAAHPDDETLGAGGLIAAAARSGLAITVLVATSGEGSHPLSPTCTPAVLAQIRRAEVLAAAKLLAPSAVVELLDLPDGDLTAHQDELLAAVQARLLGPSTLLVAPFVSDGHPDHEAAGSVAARAAAAAGATSLGYPIWMWHWGSSQELPDGLVRFDLDPVDRKVKAEALQCHRSQTEPLSELPGDEAVVAPGFAAHFDREFEIFVAATVPAGGSVRAADHPPGGRSLTREFFDDFYGDTPDPWGFESRWYETRKRALTLASLPRERFSSGYEPGCSIGVLTAELAGRCEALLATDISQTPLLAARARLAGSAGVRFEQRRVPQEWPTEKFDLVVLSEIGYYCDTQDLDTLVRRASGSLTDDGVLVACHWRHPVREYPLGGDDVHRAIRERSGLALLAEHREADFLLEVYVRPPAISVAGAVGLLG